MKVLIVDDEPDVLLLCRVNLVFSGHEVVEASDAPTAIKMAIEEQPDIIVLDVMLPHGDGISVLRELQRRPETLGIPVIMLTAKARSEDEMAGFEAGATLYMTKPFSPATLVEALLSVAEMSPEQRKGARARNLQQLAVLQKQ